MGDILSRLPDVPFAPPQSPRAILRTLPLHDILYKNPASELCQLGTIGEELIGDPLHPSDFVEIYEREAGGTLLPLFRPIREQETGNARGLERGRETAAYEVDERSSIVVRFDREHLVSHASRLDFTIGVTATVYSGSDAQPAEVLGYRELGKNENPPSASVAAAARLIGQICDVAAWPGQSVDSLPLLARFAQVAGMSVDALGSAPDTLQGELDSLRNEWRIEAAEMGAGLVGLRSWLGSLDRLADLDEAELEPLTGLANTTAASVKARLEEMRSAANALLRFTRGIDWHRTVRRADEALKDYSDAFTLLNPFLSALQNALVGKSSPSPAKELAKYLISNLRDADIPLRAQGFAMVVLSLLASRTL